jgi:hypothetical protein
MWEIIHVDFKQRIKGKIESLYDIKNIDHNLIKNFFYHKAFHYLSQTEIFGRKIDCLSFDSFESFLTYLVKNHNCKHKDHDNLKNLYWNLEQLHQHMIENKIPKLLFDYFPDNNTKINSTINNVKVRTAQST